MLMIYGLFVFSVHSAPFNQMGRDTNYDWASNSRVGDSPAYQFIGKGEETITLDGVLMPEFSGGPLSLDLLRMLADSGEAWLLMSGAGKIYGYYFVESLSETSSHFLADGTAQKIDFTLTLKRYDSSLGLLGAISPFIPMITKLF